MLRQIRRRTRRTRRTKRRKKQQHPIHHHHHHHHYYLENRSSLPFVKRDDDNVLDSTDESFPELLLHGPVSPKGKLIYRYMIQVEFEDTM
jgi:hypothetical protein